MAPLNLELEDLNSKVRELVEEAYRRGFVAGMADARDRILRSLSGIEERKVSYDSPAPPSEEKPLPTVSAESFQRVERGAVRVAVQHVMSVRPGLSASDIARAVTEYDPRITSAGSVSNELNRNDGTLYERRNGLWYPLSPRKDALDRNAEGPAHDDARPSHMNGAPAVSAA